MKSIEPQRNAAAIGGFANDNIVKRLTALPIISLRIPITAKYEQRSENGDIERFAIGRNENNEYFAEQLAGSKLYSRTINGRLVDAARSILEQDLGSTRVDPKGV